MLLLQVTNVGVRRPGYEAKATVMSHLLDSNDATECKFVIVSVGVGEPK